jgi:hypothetical protein
MTYFLKSGNRFTVSTKEALDLHELLPPGNYVVKKDPYENLFLEQIDSFEIKGKLYGDTSRNTKRILATFNDRSVSTGVMLNGEKGSGKTLLAKNICYEAYKLGIPTIVINAAWCGDKFNSLIQEIEQPTIVLFDEFEKVYDQEEQQAMLTLLDGVFPSKKLFILTCNDKWRVNEHMRNRPGRIFYMLDFAGLEPEFIREYCNDNLENEKHADAILQIASVFDKFNFDMLKALVEEVNRFDETPQQAIRMLNTKPEFSGKSKFGIKLVINGEEIPAENMGRQELSMTPLSADFELSYRKVNLADKNDFEWEEVNFSPQDLKKIDDDGMRYVFSNTTGGAAILTKVKDKEYRYWDAF